MHKPTTLILMFCFILSGTFCYANGMVGMKKEKDNVIPIIVKEKASYGGLDKSDAITTTINGHLLMVAFLENLGQVTVEITTATDSPEDFITMATPNGYQYYIPNTGDYIITFTLENGDIYYGEFTVTD